MKELVVAAMKRLKEQVPELGCVDINVGQMMATNPQVNYPCALVDISDGMFSNASCGIQQGTLTLDVELYFANSGVCNDATVQEVEERATSYFDVVEKVCLALQGMDGESFTRLSRSRIFRDKENEYPCCLRIQFSCTMRDESAKTVWTKVTLRPKKEESA